jgi:hypothetical protein
LLCFNCNNAKAFFGSCPHQDGLEAELDRLDVILAAS